MEGNAYIFVRNNKEELKIKLILESYGYKPYLLSIVNYPKYIYFSNFLYTDVHFFKDNISKICLEASDFINKY